MRIILKILAAPFVLLLSIVLGVLTFLSHPYIILHFG